MLKDEYTASITLHDGTAEKVDKETLHLLTHGLISFPLDLETAVYFGKDELTGLFADVIPVQVYNSQNAHRPPVNVSVRIDLAIAIYNGEYMEE